MCIQRRGYVHASIFFYRKNGRNFTLFALEHKVATAFDAPEVELYV